MMAPDTSSEVRKARRSSGRALAGTTSHEMLAGLSDYYHRALANNAGDELLKHIEQALFHVRAIHAEMCPRDECES